MIAGAQFGGPIGMYYGAVSCKQVWRLLLTCDITAMIRDDRKVLLLQKQQPIKPMIYMYTSAGKLIEQIQVERAHAHQFY